MRNLALSYETEDLWEWAHRLPKIDLHRHLEGSLRLDTLAEIALEHGIDLPSYDIEQLRPYVQVTDEPPDYLNFLQKFSFLHRFYTSKEAVQRVVREAITDAANDNIRYLELRFNPQALANVQGFSMDSVVEWVIEATEQAQTSTGTRTCLILTIPRGESLQAANEILELGIAYFGPWIRGIDLVGDEVNFPAKLFIEPFRRAREAGLNITIHAGEWAGPESVYTAVHDLGAQRIGHGIHSIEDSNVVQLLYERGIALEICPTSNLQTGAVYSITQHPLLDLYNLRLRVTLNTDDPSISDTTLSDEYAISVAGMGIEPRQIYRMLRHSVEAAFIPAGERAWLTETVRRELVSYPGAVEEFDAL
ncbi:MAG TPA: adenosine deaminase [Anaerolineae bacterium]|nr:adenosine deaminase [Anaerolineae bacterium]HQH39009.1 adenosine deaminase [Anaerolineae bacterium]